ncbi:Choline/ethanolamine kinase [Halotydeus destructor]|nr:Choline/ethanolamine kinase [Halotydeus destructor]
MKPLAADMASNAAESRTRRVSQMYNHAEDVSKEAAMKYCANFIGGSWATLDQQHFDIQVIPRGMINRIFLCENKSEDNGVPNEPKKVVLRLYGGKTLIPEKLWRNGGVMEDVMVTHTMSSLGLGPKLLGVFPGGRLEQYVEGRMFSDEDFQSPEMETLFARKLARMHAIKMPFSRKHRDTLDMVAAMMTDWLDGSKSEFEKMNADAAQKGDNNVILQLDMLEELEWLKSLKPRIKTRQVLSHGDMNRTNCLVVDETDLMLIDYEFSNYGLRGGDIGSHFNARLKKIAKFNDGFKSDLGYPTENERRHFIRSYNEEMRRLNAYDLDESENGLDNEDNMLAEAEYMVLASIILLLMMLITNFKGKLDAGFSVHVSITLIDRSDLESI